MKNTASLLDTLAAAYAEEGRFPEGIATIEKAMAGAQAANATNDVVKFGTRRELYSQQQPWRSP